MNIRQAEPASASARIPLHPKYVKSDRLGRRIMEYKAWMNAGREKVGVANAPPNLPKLSARYSKGEISYSKEGALVLKALKLATERRDREITAEREQLREGAKGATEAAEDPAGERVSAETSEYEQARVRNIRRRLQRGPAGGSLVGRFRVNPEPLHFRVLLD